MIERVIANLLDNVLKYSPHDTKVTLRLNVESGGAGPVD
jgi:K+-sensing histidine kinase KdpD